MIEIIVSLIAVSGGIILAAISYYLTKSQQREAEWRKEKLNYYKVFLSSLSSVATGSTDEEYKENIILASNTIVLVAPQNIVTSLMDFWKGLAETSNPTPEKFQELLNPLILLIRKDLGIKPKDDKSTFEYRMYGKGAL